MAGISFQLDNRRLEQYRGTMKSQVSNLQTIDSVSVNVNWISVRGKNNVVVTVGGDGDSWCWTSYPNLLVFDRRVFFLKRQQTLMIYRNSLNRIC